MKKNDVKNFQTVLSEERATIGKAAAKEHLTGLAFSGGGIRSATFNLGIIQSLAKQNLLQKFDYLSTVSGGSYIGSWLSAQIHRHTDPDDNGTTGKQKVESFQESLSASLEPKTEHEAVKWLRSYSNYLTPKKGLSGDTFSALGTWLRNTLLNQVSLLLFFASLILLLQVMLLTLNRIGCLGQEYSKLWLQLSVLLISWAIYLCAKYLPKLRCCADSKCTASLRKEAQQPTFKIISIAVLAAYSLNLWMYSVSSWTITDGSLSLIAGVWAVIYALPWMIIVICSLLKPELKRCAQCPHTQDEDNQRHPKDSSHTTALTISSPGKFAFWSIFSAMAAGAFGGWLIYLLSHAVSEQNENIRLWWAEGFGTPLLLIVFCLILVLHQGLMARLFRVSQLEWWARLGGYVMFIAAAWAGIHVLLIYAPPLIDMLEYKFIAAGGFAWLIHSIAGVILGKGADTGALNSAQRKKELIVRAAPYVFVLGYLVATSWVVHALMYQFGTEETPGHFNLIVMDENAPPSFNAFLVHALQINNNADIATLWYVLAAGSAAFLILAWRLDVNLFSIHHFYRNRLTRCYLGAGRGDDRVPNSFTGFDPCDDIKLAELNQRPLHLINTALNLVHGHNLAWQDRKAYSFTFSPVYCGFQYPPNSSQQGGGYYSSKQYMSGVRVGTAMAASGAAASPNMGYHSSPAVAFLLTVFNVRLGHWCPNTAAHTIKQCAIERESPAMGGEYLLKELFGQTDDKNTFVYLSDGGHFENLGVYELVRRRCRYIMVVDAGQDKDRTFEDAANIIRKCYIDFGVTIDIKLDALHTYPNGNSLSCFALGDINYPAFADDGSSKGNDDWGVLLYIKPSLLENIPEDIRQYAKTNLDFPHQTTGDQFFDEAQFESYRHLGNYLMDEVLKSVNRQETPSGRSWNWEDM